MSSLYELRIGYMGETPLITLYGDGRGESYPKLKLTAIDGWDKPIQRDRITVQDPNGGTYVDPFSKPIGKIVSVNFSLINLGDYAAWKVIQTFKKLGIKDKLLKLTMVTTFEGEVTITESLNDCYSIDEVSMEKRKNEFRFTITFGSKNFDLTAPIIEPINPPTPVYTREMRVSQSNLLTTSENLFASSTVKAKVRVYNSGTETLTAVRIQDEPSSNSIEIEPGKYGNILFDKTITQEEIDEHKIVPIPIVISGAGKNTSLPINLTSTVSGMATLSFQTALNVAHQEGKIQNGSAVNIVGNVENIGIIYLNGGKIFVNGIEKASIPFLGEQPPTSPGEPFSFSLNIEFGANNILPVKIDFIGEEEQDPATGEYVIPTASTTVFFQKLII